MSEYHDDWQEALNVSVLALKGIIERAIQTLDVPAENIPKFTVIVTEAWGRGVRDGMGRAISGIQELMSGLPK